MFSRTHTFALLLVSLLGTPLLADSMAWTGTRDNATVTNGTQVYTQAILTALDPSVPDGPLKMIDTTNDVSWLYNPHIFTQNGVLSQWHWRIGDHKWNFDIVEGKFSYDGGKHIWERYGSGLDWLNRETEEQWEFLPHWYSHGYIDLWKSVITTEEFAQGI